MHSPTVGSEGAAVSYERGTPVTLKPLPQSAKKDADLEDLFDAATKADKSKGADLRS